MSLAILRASDADLIAPLDPGTTGTPLFSTACFAATLSPMSSICSAVGPIKVKPCSSRIDAKLASSDRKP